jgi:DNA polymerase elongation subunit (family B)
VRETRAVSAILSQSYFIQAQIFPFSYQNVALRGNATKIDALLIREYLRQRHAIPVPEPPQEVLGGHTEIAYQGVARHVLHCDVTSLYPSVMLAFGYFPRRDSLGVFASLLKDLRAFRVQAKRLARTATTDEARAHYEALQSTFKILINSFYGYLGFSMGHFNDFQAANQVTAKGRELIHAVMAWLKDHGARLIEIDTDGLYFVAPTDVRTAEDEERLLSEMSQVLPEGISLELDGRYQAMFSYKMKNYALLDEAGRLSITGSGLRSRGLELFQREWMEEMFRHFLMGEPQKIRELTRRYAEAFEQHTLDVRKFMKTETLQDSLETYRDKIKGSRRNPAAAYELALRSARPYQPGDQISYYVSGTSKKVKVHEAAKLASEWDSNHPDENVEYYKAKLVELSEKFRPFFESSKND